MISNFIFFEVSDFATGINLSANLLISCSLFLGYLMCRHSMIAQFPYFQTHIRLCIVWIHMGFKNFLGKFCIMKKVRDNANASENNKDSKD